MGCAKGDGSSTIFTFIVAFIRFFNAVVHGIPDEMNQRAMELFGHGFIQFCICTMNIQIDLFLILDCKIPYDPFHGCEYATHFNHPNLLNLILEFSDRSFIVFDKLEHHFSEVFVNGCNFFTETHQPRLVDHSFSY